MPMKVTVCFDRVRVIVPCGDGEIPVHSLIEKAITRFKKATAKSADYWVSVNNLRTTDGGILDPDDLLVDVVDDKEQLLADYEEQGVNNYQPHNGDGASASSTGTASPEPVERPKTYHNVNEDDTVVVTPKDLSAGSRLRVRRGSEPTLHVLNDNISAPVNCEVKNVIEEHSSDETSSPRNGTHNSATTNPFNRFARDSWRQSLGNRPDMYKWLVAQEKQQDRVQMERKEPLGGVSTDVKKDIPDVISRAHQPHIQGSILINLPTEGGPLGIHVVPDYNEEGKENGLLVHGVEPGGRVDKDGRLRENDRIVEINGISLVNVSFIRARETFSESMKSDEIKIRIVKKKPAPGLPKQPPPTLPKPRGYSPTKPSPLTLPPPKLNSPNSLSPTGPEKTSTPTDSGPSSSNSPLPDSTDGRPVARDPQPIKPGPPIRPGLPIKPQSPTKKVPPAVPVRDPKTSLSSQENAIIAPTNTKKIGTKISLQLKKGPSGLGFSVTTRDNPAGGFTPIYIKNILQKGAAIEEGTLKAGDRLLMVNGVDMDGKSQSEVVALLRNVKLGETVSLEISRQVTEDDRFKVPRQLDGRLAINDQLLEVNGESLRNLSNSESMETLRKAMQKEGVIQGHIHLTIARKIGAPSPSPFQESSTDYFLYSLNKSSDYSESNDSKEIVSVPPDVTQNIHPVELKDYGVDKSRNFLIERLMGASNGLRNESYTRATHDSFNDSGNVSSPEVSPIKPLKSAPTVHELLERNTRNSILIEDDSHEPQTRMRPHSTLGILRHNSTNSSSSEEGNQQPPWLQSQDWDRHHSTTSEELVSPMGDAATAFSREGFGRQSMSEKRKGHIDPNQSEVYQKIKTIRDSNRGVTTRKTLSFQIPAQSGQKRVSSNFVRVGSMESLMSNGNRSRLPPLPLKNVHYPANGQGSQHPVVSNLKRFGSLENLATTGTSSDNEDKRESPETIESSPSPELPHMARGRKCNDSFRAAVDRSYDPPTPHSTMDTCNRNNESEPEEEDDPLNSSGGFAVQGDVEEESSESNLPNSARSSVSSDHTDDNKKTKKKNPKDKKGGILKGIFRIGKHKKTEEPAQTLEDDKDSLKEAELQFKVREEAIRAHQKDQERAQEQFRRLQESNQPSEQYRLLQHYHGSNRSFDSDQSPPSNMSRADWIQYLRMEHQRKHRERHGHYPHEDREEFHEQEIQQSLEKPQYYGDSAIHNNMYHQKPRSLSRQQFDRPEHYQVHPFNHHYEQQEQPRYQRQPAVEIFHQRQSSDTLENTNSYRDNFVPRMPSRSHTPIERYFDGELSYHEKPVRYEHSSGYYRDPIFAYRDPVYPSVAGKRPVQTISQSGSAKV
ncbi:partitioning defective 3 homolog B-like isoform X6 [Mytilus californianus]|uniref:partitioning defective 3 homolog B-like isoform X6 n=1 Tax=Mytilus californianus TaxID=6549 RepID=UPI0022459BA7|nr:partitioning defective 3 homolog B-like isoform X6 [Mytilus californianus]